MDALRLQALTALEHFIGDPVIVLKGLLLARLYVFAAHEGIRTSVLRYEEPVAQLWAVPSYSSSWHAGETYTHLTRYPKLLCACNSSNRLSDKARSGLSA